MSALHSPGPWRHRRPRDRRAGFRLVEAPTGELVASVWANALADAPLIAAAPDLLQLAHEYAAECGECAGTGLAPDDTPCDDPQCQRVRAVIAAAEVR